MKMIVYNLCSRVNRGTEENPQWESVLTRVSMEYNSRNEQIARQEAHEGSYEIVEAEEPEVYGPIRLDAMEAQLAYTAMMTDTLLEE